MRALGGDIRKVGIRGKFYRAALPSPTLDGITKTSGDPAAPPGRLHVDSFEKRDQAGLTAVNKIMTQRGFGEAYGQRFRRSAEEDDRLIQPLQKCNSFLNPLIPRALRPEQASHCDPIIQKLRPELFDLERGSPPHSRTNANARSPG